MTRPRRRPWLALTALALAFVALVALGTWQMRRRAWKLDLIARVDARVHAPPVDAPGPGGWAALTREHEEYRRVTAYGRFLAGRETRVQAVTELGAGDWLMTPLATTGGFTLLVNRGFMPGGTRAATPAGPVTVTGLLRWSEPGGGFLRANDPAGGRWYSRDVAAIAVARKLGATAPYFIDADATPNPGGLPVGGLTVIMFPNNHLVYALTWYGLALMTAGAAAVLLRDEARLRKGRGC